jgi:hypothetical protein
MFHFFPVCVATEPLNLPNSNNLSVQSDEDQDVHSASSTRADQTARVLDVGAASKTRSAFRCSRIFQVMSRRMELGFLSAVGLIPTIVVVALFKAAGLRRSRKVESPRSAWASSPELQTPDQGLLIDAWMSGNKPG